jgi:hypothetical protein
MPAGGRADDRAMIVSGSPGGYAARRVLAGIVALPFTGYALLALAGLLRPRFEPIGTMLFLVSATWAALLWWFALRGHIEESRAHMRVTLIGGFVIGGIAFAAGIFVTGPLGFVVGVAGGWLYGHTRRHPPDGLARAA